jgi:hypothetical protein
MRIQAEPSDIFAEVNGARCRVWNAITDTGDQIFLFVHRVAVPSDGELVFADELIPTETPKIDLLL